MKTVNQRLPGLQTAIPVRLALATDSFSSIATGTLEVVLDYHVPLNHSTIETPLSCLMKGPSLQAVSLEDSSQN